MRVIGKLAAAALLMLSLQGCVGAMTDSRDVMDTSQLPPERGHTIVENNTKPLQCVPYARLHSAIKIFGDAYTWWDKAAGKYPRGTLPQPGAVMVLNNYAGATRGHVAVVRRVTGAREIRVDHANWLDDGSIYVNNPVEDVSSGNDWSVVRVYNLKTGGWGVRLYPVQGFIGPGGDAPDRQEDNSDGRPDLVADRDGSSMGATTLIGKIN
jgi:surface antigen